MASSSGRKSGSSGSSSSRKRVAIGAEETVRVRYKQGTPQVESERKPTSRQSQRSKSERAGSRVPKPSGAGHRVASQKRDERDRRRREIGRRRVLLGAALAAVVFALAWGLAALWQAPLFKVDVVKVTGNSRLKTAEIVALAAVPSDATLLRLPSAAITERIQSSPWVASAKIKRAFPNAIVIEVTERVPVAVVDTGAQGAWLVTRDGWWIAKRGKEPTGTLVAIRDVPGLVPVAGRTSGSAQVANALAIIAGLSPQMKAQLKFVSAETIERTKLVLKNDIVIFIGSAEQIAKKDLIARAILSKQKDVVSINVRVTDRPTWRGLDATD